jgi:nucleotide-binding universal stress UspA family protein
MVSRILAPIDGSEFSRRALALALSVARGHDARVNALYVRPGPVAPLEPTGEPVSPPIQRWLEGPDHAAVQKMVADADAGDRLTLIFRDGLVVPEILAAARELAADMIVMGTHGTGGFERFLMGSVTEKVLRKAGCPVLTVPAGVEPTATGADFGTILCGIDRSPASYSALARALSLSQYAQGRLILTQVLEVPAPEHETVLGNRIDLSDYRRAVEAETVEHLSALVPEGARAWCAPEIVVRFGKPHVEIVRLAQERGAKLIAIGTHGRGRLDGLLFGSTANQVVREATCPVLTVPPGQP